jgi:hypothetical protein
MLPWQRWRATQDVQARNAESDRVEIAQLTEAVKTQARFRLATTASKVRFRE